MGVGGKKVAQLVIIYINFVLSYTDISMLL